MMLDAVLSQSADIDLGMELLCCLTTSETLCGLIAQDLSIDLRQTVYLVSDLRRRGYPVQTRFNHLRQRVAWIDPPDWEKCQQAAQAYWDKVYKEESNVA